MDGENEAHVLVVFAHLVAMSLVLAFPRHPIFLQTTIVQRDKKMRTVISVRNRNLRPLKLLLGHFHL